MKGIFLSSLLWDEEHRKIAEIAFGAFLALITEHFWSSSGGTMTALSP